MRRPGLAYYTLIISCRVDRRNYISQTDQPPERIVTHKKRTSLPLCIFLPRGSLLVNEAVAIPYGEQASRIVLTLFSEGSGKDLFPGRPLVTPHIIETMNASGNTGRVHDAPAVTICAQAFICYYA